MVVATHCLIVPHNAPGQAVRRFFLRQLQGRIVSNHVLLKVPHLQHVGLTEIGVLAVYLHGLGVIPAGRCRVRSILDALNKFRHRPFRLRGGLGCGVSNRLGCLLAPSGAAKP